jgi:hypothetical protein
LPTAFLGGQTIASRPKFTAIRPEKYQGLGKNEGVIEDIEIKKLAGNE